jgi:C1A family cysteine protease
VLATGLPIVIGFTVYESFESSTVASTGMVPMPGHHEKQVGGHCVVLVGYDDSQSMFIVRNSWGTSWGMAGYFMMPYAYLTNPRLSSDFWMATGTE